MTAIGAKASTDYFQVADIDWRSCARLTFSGMTSTSGNNVGVSNWSVDFDPDNWWADPSGNPSRLVPPHTGSFLIIASAIWDTNATGARILAIEYGSASVAQDRKGAINGGKYEQCVSTMQSTTVGGGSNFVRLLLNQTSGADRTASGVISLFMFEST